MMVQMQAQSGQNMARMMANLSAKLSFVPNADQVSFSQFTKIVNHVDAVDTWSNLNDLLFFGFDAQKRVDLVLIIDN